MGFAIGNIVRFVGAAIYRSPVASAITFASLLGGVTALFLRLYYKPSPLVSDPVPPPFQATVLKRKAEDFDLPEAKRVRISEELSPSESEEETSSSESSPIGLPLEEELVDHLDPASLLEPPSAPSPTFEETAFRVISQVFGSQGNLGTAASRAELHRSSDYGPYLVATIGPWHREHPLCQDLDRLQRRRTPSPLFPNFPALSFVTSSAISLVQLATDSAKEAPFTQLLRNLSQSYLQRQGNGARALFTQPMLTVAAALLSRQLPMDNGTLSFGKLIQEDRKAIEHRKLTPEDYEGDSLRASRKAKAKMNFFKPFEYNLPFSVGRRTINGASIETLRHAVPTKEEGSVSILNSYRSFLQSCREAGESVLYNSLLDPHAADEKKRIEALERLSNNYPDTFHFIRFPLDGRLTKFEGDFDCYRKAVQEELRLSLEGSSSTFLFSPAVKRVVEAHQAGVLQFAKEQIEGVYGEEKDSKEARKAFFMLFCVVLKAKILSELRINYYCNTCKDAIDRGAAHLLCDLLLDSMLTNSLRENRPILRVLTAFPAFMAKTQGILKKRAEYITAFSNFLDRMPQVQRNSFKEVLKGELNLEISPLEFNLEELYSRAP